MSHPRLLLFCGCASGLLAAVTLVPLGPLEVFELKTVDVRMWSREMFQRPAPRTEVRTYVLDDAALGAAERGGESEARVHAALQRVIAPGQVKREVLGLELPTWHSVATPLLEQELRSWMRAAAPESATRVVVGLRYGAQVFGRDPELPPLGVTPLPQSAGEPAPTPPAVAVAPPSAEIPLPQRILQGRGVRLGEIEFTGDHDGVVRRVPLVMEREGRLYPAFVLQVICAHDDVQAEDASIQLGRAILLRRNGKVVRRIPIDSEGRLLVNYRRRTPDASVPVLERPGGSGAGETAGIPPAGALGAVGTTAPAPSVVLLGTSARWVSDFHNVPAGGRDADIEVAAEALQTVLTSDYIHRINRITQYFFTWAILFFGSLAMVRLRSWRGVLFGFGLVALYFVVEKLFFLLFNVWIDFVLPVIALTWATTVFPVWGYHLRMQRLLSEMRLLRRFDDLVLMNIARGLIVADRHGLVMRHNPRAAELLGRSGEALHGRHVRELFAVSPAMLELLGQVMGRGRPGGDGWRLPMTTQVSMPVQGSGSERILELEVALVDPELLKSPEPADLPCYVLTFDDVTEQVQRAHQDARRARLAAMGEIAAKLGHEIRNSLGGLRLYVENLREEIDPTGSGVRTIDGMVREIQSLYRKIDELRQYGMDPQLQLVRCDLKDLIEEALAFASQKLSEKHIRVVLECERGMPPVLVDRRQLREAFQNLINNAIEAAPEGGRVSILAERTHSGNGTGRDQYEVHFEDNGPGIPTEIQDQVFSLFFTTKPDAGTGLGLPIVKKIVESHGGRVAFANGRDGGATFTVTLPATGKEGAA